MDSEKIDAHWARRIDAIRLHVRREIAAAVSPVMVRLTRAEADIMALEAMLAELEQRLAESGADSPALRLVK